MIWRLIRFEENNAIIQNENEDQITIPHHLLPAEYNIGDQFSINFDKNTDSAPESKEATQIINTILETK
ncbi:DUF3006 domain-containing protein [Patescibacteria group bacterium]|nr:DUF3006 domain-containing protein [Patescibacteria group bacterium]